MGLRLGVWEKGIVYINDEPIKLIKLAAEEAVILCVVGTYTLKKGRYMVFNGAKITFAGEDSERKRCGKFYFEAPPHVKILRRCVAKKMDLLNIIPAGPMKPKIIFKNGNRL